MIEVPLRASSSGRWVRCPASAGLEAQFPNLDTPEAMEGTAAHEMLEHRLRGTIASSHELVGQKATNGVTFDDEMVEHVETLNLILDTWRGDNLFMYVEQKVMTPQNNVPGHVDIGVWNQFTKTIHICDFKYGRRDVDPKHNEQLIHYGLGLERALGVKADWFQFVVFQPRCYASSDPLKTWYVHSSDLAADVTRIVNAAADARSSHPTAQWGEHCRDCKAAHGCEALRDAVMMGSQIIENGTYEVMSAQDAANEITLYRRIERLMKTRLEAIEEHAISLINDGQPLPGYSQQATYHNRAWIDATTPKTLGDLYGVDLVNKKPMTPNQAAAALGVKSDRLEKFTKRIQSGVKLVEKDLTDEAEKVFGK